MKKKNIIPIEHKVTNTLSVFGVRESVRPMIIIQSLAILITCLFISSCETTYHPELESSANILVIDAWLEQKMETQEIRITRSQPYFENRHPEPVADAEVWVEDLNTGDIYAFNQDGDRYVWEPGEKAFGEIGNTYRLHVVVNQETFIATATLNRVPEIDSFRFHFYEEDFLIKQDYYMAEFLASDLPGTGDTYWIKAWKNGEFLGKPSELNMVYDAGFAPGQGLDGTVFLLPIRKDFINPLDKVPDSENEFLPPYLPGDSVSVEIHSIDQHAYDFLWEVYYYTVRPGGIIELFSTPLANARTNLKSTLPGSETEVAGFFNVAAVSSGGKTLTIEHAEQLKQAAKNN